MADLVNETDKHMTAETNFKPNWRAKLIWVGNRPTEEMVGEVASDKLKKKEDPLQGTRDIMLNLF